MFGLRFQTGGVETAHAIYAFRDVQKQAGIGGGAPRSGARTHTVKLGETWMSIAMRYATQGGLSASSIAGLLREPGMMAGHT